jgi:hypothetical protein
LLPNHAFSSWGVNAVEYGEKKKQVLRVTMDRLYDMLMQVGYLLAKARLSIPFRFTRNDRNIPYQLKKKNKTEQILSHFKSWSILDFSAKFRPKRSGFIPHVPFRS